MPECPRTALFQGSVIQIVVATIVCLGIIVTTGHAAIRCESVSGVPGSYSHSSFYIKQAQANKPQTLSFRTTGPLFFTLTRASRTITGRANIVVSRSNAKEGASEIVCETGWTDPVRSHTFSTPRENDHDGIWTIQVFDEISGGPTGEIPYVIQMILSTPRVDNTLLRRLRGSLPSDVPFGNNARNRTFSLCGLSSGSLRSQSTLEIATSDTFTDVGEGLPQTYFIHADRYVYLRIRSPIKSVITVTISAKEPGVASFAPVCNIEKRSTELIADGMIYAVATWDRLLNPLWRVEVSAKPVGESYATQANQVIVEILRQRDPERRMDQPLDFLASCYICKTVRRSTTETSNSIVSVVNGAISKPLDFLTAVSVTVPSNFTPRQNSLLEQSIETGVAIWSAECSWCTIDTLSVLKVGPRRLMRADLLQAIQEWPGPLSKLMADKRLSGLRLTLGSGPMYKSVSDDDPTIKKLCGAAEAALPDYFQRVAFAYGCRPGSKPESKAVVELMLEVTDGPTDCGKSVNIVACEPDRELLELNGKDYSFGILGGDTWIGSGPRHVNLLHVILHEIGHWLWMGHVSNDASIMSEVLNTSQCINDADIAELREAIQRRREHPYFFPGPQALLARKIN
ncbi:matrixin [Edaphobacter aggregans]|uniref:Matrixin n=1 Tax=Edaphobacter aggregans TaxID=570835 RepID=A0A428MLG7_9BACT|nr:matrixin family metalloprotease [Edaphobacter aggregans]RSL17696.1 matrixin [Edaphobacter aggregans]